MGAGVRSRAVASLPYYSDGILAVWAKQTLLEIFVTFMSRLEATGAIAHPILGTPDIAAAAFIAPNATIIGRVTLAAGANIWYGAVLRGDVERIDIGENTNVQDGAVIHGDPGQPTILEADVTVGHRAIIHSAHIERGCTIGMGAIILNGVRVGAGSIVGAGAVVTKEVPPRSLVVGIPGKVVRSLSDQEVAEQIEHAARYVKLALVHGGQGTDLGFHGAH